MQPTDLGTLTWRKSSYSTGNAACVEVARTPGAVALRDAKDANGPGLFVSPTVFASFVRSLRTEASRT